MTHSKSTYMSSSRQSTAPLPIDDLYVEEDPNRKTHARVVISVSSDEMHAIGGVIVFGWDHVVPRISRAGSKNRAYHMTFTEQERKTLGRWHTCLYDFEMRRGYPVEGTLMKPSTHALLRRAANFFATI